MSASNIKLLNDSTNGMLLTAIERQRRLLIRLGSQRKPCPNCGTLHNLPEARGVEFDEFDFGNHGSDDNFRCTGCRRGIVYTLPWPTGDWYWRAEMVTPKGDV